MVSINRVTLAGRLTRDPELKYTKGGMALCNIGLAVSERVKKGEEWKEEVLFVDKITVWGKPAENASEYLKKGSPVLIEGKLRKNQWESEDGKKHSSLEIVADKIHYLSDKGKQPTQNQNQSEDQEPIKDENIPF